ncbi:LytR C-terminal domain-containing protein [Nocardia sp. R16R-3T]
MSYPNPTSGGPPLRALAMVLIALAIVFAGLGAMSLSSSDSDTSGSGESSSATSRAAATTAVATTNSPVQTTSAASATAKPSSTTTGGATPNRGVPVHVLNNSTVAGLAARTASALTANGWTVAEVGNYPGPNLSNTTVFYGNNPGEKEAALAIADELGATAQPRSGGSGPGVTVVVTGS